MIAPCPIRRSVALVVDCDSGMYFTVFRWYSYTSRCYRRLSASWEEVPLENCAQLMLQLITSST